MSTKADLKKLLLDYTNYEEALTKKQVANGAPPPIAPHFSFARFYNWLFELGQVE